MAKGFIIDFEHLNFENMPWAGLLFGPCLAWRWSDLRIHPAHCFNFYCNFDYQLSRQPDSGVDKVSAKKPKGTEVRSLGTAGPFGRMHCGDLLYEFLYFRP
jgi:hypothetical protein